MPTIEIYTSPFCGFCHRAKHLLASKGVAFTEIDVSGTPKHRAEMVARSNGGRTVPQIFINGTHVGGCDDLFALDRRGGLDPMLKAG